MAEKVRFTKDYDHPISFGVDKAYKKGMELLVPEAHADGAIKAGAAEKVAESSAAKTEKKAEAKG